MPDPQTVTPASTDTTNQVSYANMAAKIRAKYPQSKLYKAKPDKELVEAWVQAKPERAVYAKRIKGYDPDNTGGKGVPSGTPHETPTLGTGSPRKTTLETATDVKKRVGAWQTAADASGAAYPNIGGMAGGVLGKTPGATIGGAVGEGLKQVQQRILFDKEIDNKKALWDITKEAAVQGGMEKGGQFVGTAFFKILSRIPHAEIKGGIRLLASEVNGGKITRYVEDLLTNLIPSAGIMGEFKAAQHAEIVSSVDTLAKGMSKFKGTTEEMGQLLQDTYRKLESGDRQSLLKTAKTLTNPKDIEKTPAYKEYVKFFKNELANKIAKTNKPELIGGFLRKAGSLEETRTMTNMLEERAPRVMNAVRTRLMQDVIQETLTGAIDPVMKDAQKTTATYSGKVLKENLDKIGEERLKAIYTPKQYEAIMEFADLTKRVGANGGSGVGKFVNLAFLLAPIRTGIKLTTGVTLTKEAILVNRAARIMTSTEGVRAYENYIRATAMGGVKGTKLALDELKVFAKRADEEYQQEQEAVADQYYKDHPDEVKYRQTNKKE